jgi:nicotinamide mononucleotide (NMN) deamidase PncC
VGTIYVSVVVKGEALTRRFQFAGERASVNWQATQVALDLLRRGLGTRS